MTISSLTDLDVRTDGHVDRRVDDCKDTQPATNAASAFVIVLANHKGGVTKTTSVANTGAALAMVATGLLFTVPYALTVANLTAKGASFDWVLDLIGQASEEAG